MHPLLEIKNLHISFTQGGQTIPAVRDVSFNIKKGKLTAIVGESGSGKSLTALSILNLLPKEAVFTGDILFSPDSSRQIILNQLPEKKLNTIRGNQVAMIFQEPMTSLNPVFTCGYQVMETLQKHQQLNNKEARQRAISLFENVELPDPAAMIDRYPHQLSGGQKQRVMIAMAMCCNPALLIADEPTTALDVRVQKNILELIRKLQQQNNMSVLLNTHDLALVADVADVIIVMYKGEIVEQGNAMNILKHPQHPYTRALLACIPGPDSKGKKLRVLNDDAVQDKPGAGEKRQIHSLQNNPILSVRNLEVHFSASRNIFGKAKTFFKAVDEVSFDVMPGEIIGLVGESGCGKTTLGRAILQLVKPTAGKIMLNGKDITALSSRELRHSRKDLQIVFQDPYGSLNPRITIGDAIMEVLKVHKLAGNSRKRKELAVSMLEKVQLSPDQLTRYPHQFSGGQRQRICIARALALEPSFLIFDESVSALDVSVRAGILNLINELKADMDLTSIFISHDLSVVHYISDRIIVMNKGKIIEEGTAADIYFNPKMEYTQELINAIPGKGII